MRRYHAISPEFSGHYQNLGIASRKGHDSVCKLILSVVGGAAQVFSVVHTVNVVAKTQACAPLALPEVRIYDAREKYSRYW